LVSRLRPGRYKFQLAFGFDRTAFAAYYDDPGAFSISYKECYFIYGRSFAGRYLLVLVRILSPEEVRQFGLETKTNVSKVITARDMNRNQKNIYNKRSKAQ
jgi:hypothetical protein